MLGLKLLILFYKITTSLIAPVIYLFFRFRRKTPPYGNRAKEFLGFVPTKDYGHPLWFHTVSVGESMGAIPLIKELATNHPEVTIVVTTSTTTAMQLYTKMPANIIHLFAPLDSPCAVRRFVNRINPRALIIMETELWPNLFYCLHKKNVPITIINARLSDNSTRKYKKLGKLFMQFVGQHISFICCQTNRDLENYASLGISRSKMNITGSIKFDIKLEKKFEQESLEFKKLLNGRPVLTAASTHEGEDSLVLELYKKIKDSIPELVLFLIPRHPERFEEVYQLCTAAGFSTIRRSAHSFAPDTDILLGNTMGELPFYFECSNVVLMCGSLVDIGGHNPLEPIACGKPVISGPFIRNFKKIYKDLEERQAAICVEITQIPDIIITLLKDQTKSNLLSQKASTFLEESSGATQKTLLSLKKIITIEDQENPHSSIK